MKNHKNSQIYVWVLALSSLFCCWNGSMVTSSTEVAAQPDINFHGTLEDHAHSAPVESILIGGRYESIPVYQQVTRSSEHVSTDALSKIEEIDPKQNKTLINLQDVKSIALQHPNNPTTSSIKVNNKIYIQIVVESLHGTKKKYLVESTRKITCKEIDKSAEVTDKPTLQSRDLNFIHVKKLSIKGYRSNHPYQAPQIAPISNESSLNKTMMDKASNTSSALAKEKNNFKNNAADLLHAIEENVKNMPMDNATAFETMRSTILTLLKTLRDQLQKFLDMIK